jgi:hypothetical protein
MTGMSNDKNNTPFNCDLKATITCKKSSSTTSILYGLVRYALTRVSSG